MSDQNQIDQHYEQEVNPPEPEKPAKQDYYNQREADTGTRLSQMAKVPEGAEEQGVPSLHERSGHLAHENQVPQAGDYQFDIPEDLNIDPGVENKYREEYMKRGYTQDQANYSMKEGLAISRDIALSQAREHVQTVAGWNRITTQQGWNDGDRPMIQQAAMDRFSPRDGVDRGYQPLHDIVERAGIDTHPEWRALLHFAGTAMHQPRGLSRQQSIPRTKEADPWEEMDRLERPSAYR